MSSNAMQVYIGSYFLLCQYDKIEIYTCVPNDFNFLPVFTFLWFIHLQRFTNVGSFRITNKSFTNISICLYFNCYNSFRGHPKVQIMKKIPEMCLFFLFFVAFLFWNYNVFWRKKNCLANRPLLHAFITINAQINNTITKIM